MIEMKGKCAFLDDFFLLQKRRRLQQVNLIEKNAGIACRVAASSNNIFQRSAKSRPTGFSRMRRYRPFSYCCIKPTSTRSLTTTTIYPCHSAGGTVRAFTGVRLPFIQGSFLRLNMPSADSRYAVGSPCGSLTRSFCNLSSPFVCVSRPVGRARQGHDSKYP